MRIFALELSEDGLHNNYATNAKLLFKLLADTKYTLEVIEYYNSGTCEMGVLDFSYQNLKKVIRLTSSEINGYTPAAGFFCTSKDRPNEGITVSELLIFKHN